MIGRSVLIAATLCGIAACSAQDVSGPSDEDSWRARHEADIRSIANVFAIRKGMVLLCEGEEHDYLTAFMDELRQANIPADLRASIAADSVDMLNKISTEEPEHICTPEMFESSLERIAAAQLKWDEMRGITQ